MSMKKKKGAWIYILSFLIPTIIVLGVMIYQGITPFGDSSVFIWDARLQHKDYYGYLWDVFHGNASIEFSSGKSLGGRMLGLIGFYIASPLNILLIFFEKSQIPTFMALMIVLRIGLCGLTSQFFLRKRFQLQTMPGLLFSTAYALMEYNVYYCRNVMWLDGVILLPLIAAGVWKLISEKRKILLWASVSLAIIANWYTGYMVCLMSGLYFIYEFCISYKCHPIKAVRAGWRTIIDYLIVMLLGVMTSFVMLLPACMALIGGKATHNSVGLTGIIHFDVLHFFSGFEINAAGNNQMAPVIFCSGILLICSAYYFVTSFVDKKEKILSGVLASFLIGSFCLQDLELLWTAFVRSTSYYFRFSFIVPFFMLILASRGWKTIEKNGVQKKAVCWSVGILLAIFYILSRDGELNTSLRTLVLYMFFLVLTGILIAMYKHRNIRVRYGSVFLMVIMLFFELSYNTNKAFREYNASNTLFTEYETAMENVVEELNDRAEDNFYRFEKNDSYLTISEPGNKVATCESLLFGYNSIEHYSSAYDEKVDEFLSKIGYSDLANKQVFLCETYWNSPMILMDSLLSVKYAVMPKATYGYEKLDMDTELPFKDSDIYENMYALPLGYNVSSKLKNVEFGNNPYENQSRLLSGMIGENCRFYKDVETQFLGFDGQDEMWRVTALADGPVYFYIDSSSVHGNLYEDNCEIYVDDQYLQDTCSRFVMNSMLLGEYRAGESVEVKIRHNNTDEMSQHTIYTAQLDQEQFVNAMDVLNKGYESRLKIKGNVVSGMYTTETDSMIFLSIPYEKSWTLYVDGKKTELKELAGTFAGFELDAGTHEIRMEYHTPGFRAGIVLSIIGIVFFVIYNIVSRRKKKS